MRNLKFWIVMVVIALITAAIAEVIIHQKNSDTLAPSDHSEIIDTI